MPKIVGDIDHGDEDTDSDDDDGCEGDGDRGARSDSWRGILWGCMMIALPEGERIGYLVVVGVG